MRSLTSQVFQLDQTSTGCQPLYINPLLKIKQNSIPLVEGSPDTPPPPGLGYPRNIVKLDFFPLGPRFFLIPGIIPPPQRGTPTRVGGCWPDPPPAAYKQARHGPYTDITPLLKKRQNSKSFIRGNRNQVPVQVRHNFITRQCIVVTETE